MKFSWLIQFVGCIVLTVLMSGCSEQEEILPGKREDIRPTVVVSDRSDASLSHRIESREFNLPEVRQNTIWPQFFGTEAFRFEHLALGDDLELQWSVDIGTGDSRKQRITADPVVGGDRIFTLDADALVTAVSLGGEVLWNQDIRPIRDQRGDATGGGLAYADDILYVSSGYGQLSALDAKTGETIWRQQLDATGSGPPLVNDGLVYVVAGDDTGWAIRTENGRIAWQVAAASSVANVLGASSPILAGDHVVFAFGSGDLIAAFPKGGLRRWAVSLSGQRVGRTISRITDITGDPVAVGDRLYAGNHSGQIAALNSSNGERLWTIQEGALDPVWPAGDSIFVISDRSTLLRLDAQTGQLIWQVELPEFVSDRPNDRTRIYASHGPVLAGGRLVVTSSDGQIRFFSPVDGSLLSTLGIRDGVTTRPVIADATLYVVSTRGQLHAYR